MMKLTLSIFALLSIVSRCDFENQPVYDVEVGDTFEIYYTTNSCCHYCVLNQEDLEHIELVETKTVKTDGRCAGCNSTRAYVLKVLSPGTDTIRIAEVPGGQSCEEYDGPVEEYVVNAKE